MRLDTSDANVYTGTGDRELISLTSVVSILNFGVYQRGCLWLSASVPQQEIARNWGTLRLAPGTLWTHKIKLDTTLGLPLTSPIRDQLWVTLS